MRRTQKQARLMNSTDRRKARLLALAAVLAWASLEAFAGGKRLDENKATAPATAALVPHREIVISIPDMKLALLEDGRVLRVYPVAVGAAESRSPAGEFTVVNRVVNPAYYHEGKVIQPGKTNPLGNRWMGLSKKGYGIHGTNVPSSIGKAASHGCIRMGKHDVEELFEFVHVGDPVEIHSQRNAQVARIFGNAQRDSRHTVLAVSQTGSNKAQVAAAAMSTKF